MEDLESENLSYITIEEFLSNLKQEFGREDNEMIKTAKLKKTEQRGKTMKEFVICTRIQKSSKRKWIWEEVVDWGI